uniref:Uncharacterized protein n=1 Tax=Ciona savignyi TaxID=51511 RepID=H2ZMH3_CIOSA
MASVLWPIYNGQQNMVNPALGTAMQSSRRRWTGWTFRILAPWHAGRVEIGDVRDHERDDFDYSEVDEVDFDS